jgi:cyclopropane-fatty-acyl-phospholipid synthase
MLDSMSTNPEQIERTLAEAGIFGPGSAELALYENRLTRYFEREYQRLEDNPVTLDTLNISTFEGPMSEATENLMDLHYDENPKFFSSFLDKKYKAYTMAYYGDNPKQIMASTLNIEDAQRNKFKPISERAQIKDNERILNIGCRFAPLETYLFSEYSNIEVTGITPSLVQASYIRKRMADTYDPLSNGNFKLIEGTFDEISYKDIGHEKFDLVITIGLFEHVVNMHYVLERISDLLLPSGRSLHHFITSKIPIPQFLDPDKTRIGLYFPASRTWPQNELSRHIENQDLVKYWFVNGLNYWRTLDAWHRRIWDNLPGLYGAVFDTDAISPTGTTTSHSARRYSPRRAVISMGTDTTCSGCAADYRSAVTGLECNHGIQPPKGKCIGQGGINATLPCRTRDIVQVTPFSRPSKVGGWRHHPVANSKRRGNEFQGTGRT